MATTGQEPAAGLGFGRHTRLLNKSEYNRVFDQPERSADRYFTVLAAAGSGFAHGRLGLAIAKKTVRLAVGRNRIKRLVRESFRHHQCLLQGIDVVVLARTGAAQEPNGRCLLDALDQHWHRLIKRCAKSCS